MNSNPISNTDVKLDAEIIGLGPKFLVRVKLQNTGNSPVYGSYLTVTFNPVYYSMGYNRNSLPTLPVPVLVPDHTHIVETEIRSVDALGRSDNILIIVSSPQKDHTATPLISASVRMPVSEVEYL